MDFRLSEEHQMVVNMAKDFAENEIKPIAAELDEMERFPVESIPKLAKLGIFGSAYPVEYGGEGGDFVSYILAVEEIAKVCAATVSIINTHATVSIACVNIFGTPEQKAKYIPQMTRGGKLCGFCLTEANAGTDSSMIQTRAVLGGDHYVLNGSKMFVSTAPQNEWHIVMAMTDKSQGSKGLTAFIIHKDNPGIMVGKPIHKMGIRGSLTSEVVLENCIVPKEDVLGKEGQGMKIALTTLDAGRVCVATQAIGIAQGALDEAIKYVKERVQFGKRISQFQNTQFTIADLQTRIDAGRLLIYRAACLKDAGEPFSKEAAMAKLYCSEIANESARKSVQLMGAYGYTREYPVERMMRDAKITEIYEGTSEAQKMVIAKYLGID